MNFRNSLKTSLVVFVLMCLLMLAAKIDSYSWTEPTTDADYHVRGSWLYIAWAMTFALTLLTFVFLILVGWFRKGFATLMSYLNKSGN